MQKGLVPVYNLNLKVYDWSWPCYRSEIEFHALSITARSSVDHDQRARPHPGRNGSHHRVMIMSTVGTGPSPVLRLARALYSGHFIPESAGHFFPESAGHFFPESAGAARRGAAQSHSALGRGGPRRGVFLRLPADPP
jgi:hypothetical protein